MIHFSQPGGGGSPISNPGVAYVQTNGNDSTGEIGNPAKPYLTAQAAYNAGAKRFDLGVNVNTSITESNYGSIGFGIFVRGQGSGMAGMSRMSITVVSEVGGVDLSLYSDRSVLFETVTLSRGNSDGTFLADNCIIGTLNSINTEGGPAELVGKITFSDVTTDTANGDAFFMAHLSIIEGATRLQPPT
jgi:hypothetical protein